MGSTLSLAYLSGDEDEVDEVEVSPQLVHPHLSSAVALVWHLLAGHRVSKEWENVSHIFLCQAHFSTLLTCLHSAHDMQCNAVHMTCSFMDEFVFQVLLQFVQANIFTYSALEKPSKKMVKVGLLDQPGEGVWPNPNFLAKFPKTKFALQLAINVMKHTCTKGGRGTNFCQFF